jgi:hypothetical protein
MAESGGLPSWVEAWVGKVVQVHLHGDPDPLFGLTASRVEDVPSEPMMILVTWSSVRYVSVLMEELEKDHPRD